MFTTAKKQQCKAQISYLKAFEPDKIDWNKRRILKISLVLIFKFTTSMDLSLCPIY